MSQPMSSPMSRAEWEHLCKVETVRRFNCLFEEVLSNSETTQHVLGAGFALKVSPSDMTTQLGRLRAVDLWSEFASVPVNRDGEIESSFRHFLPHSDRDDVAEWFEETFGCSVADDLMGAETVRPTLIPSPPKRLMQVLADEMVKSERLDGVTLGDKTKRVVMNLEASTLSEYSETIEVPVGFSRDHLENLVDDALQEIDSEEYVVKNGYWERGAATFKVLQDEPESTMTMD